MVLTTDQAEAVLAHLDQTADRVQRAVQERSSGFAGIFATHSGELGAVKIVRSTLVAALHRNEPRIFLDDTDPDFLAPERWASDAKEAEKELIGIDKDSVQGSVDKILTDTAAATGKVVADAATTVAKTAGAFALSAIPWWVYLAAGGVAAWKLGLFGKRT